MLRRDLRPADELIDNQNVSKPTSATPRNRTLKSTPALHSRPQTVGKFGG